jgi:sulfur transfer protein SufE
MCSNDDVFKGSKVPDCESQLWWESQEEYSERMQFRRDD